MSEICDRCGFPSPVWFTDNDIWNALDRAGVLCPLCFIYLAEKNGVATTGWKIVPEERITSLQWRRITSEPNPESVRILTARPDKVLGNDVRIAFQTTSYEWCDDHGQVMRPRWEPTHWMPLPEPPKGNISPES